MLEQSLSMVYVFEENIIHRKYIMLNGWSIIYQNMTENKNIEMEGW